MLLGREEMQHWILEELHLLEDDAFGIILVIGRFGSALAGRGADQNGGHGDQGGKGTLPYVRRWKMHCQFEVTRCLPFCSHCICEQKALNTGESAFSHRLAFVQTTV